MDAPRAVRIPRASPDTARVVRRPASAETPTYPVPSRLRQPNRSGTQRAVRLTLLYLIVLVILYVGFLFYDRSAPGGSSPGAQGGLVTFSVVALLIAVVGAVLSLAPAPRAVERSSSSLVVVSRWGRRTEWTPIDEISVRLVRTYPAGILSDEPVESVVVSDRGRRTRSYLVERGLLPEMTAGGARR